MGDTNDAKALAKDLEKDLIDAGWMGKPIRETIDAAWEGAK